MPRPTIRDVAEAAGVSVSTVNRALGGSDAVRGATLQRIRDAAEKVGFYGLGTIGVHTAARRQKHRFGFLLNQPTRAWYKMLAAELRAAAHRVGADGHDVDVRITFAEDLSPQNIAGLITNLGKECDAIGVVAAVHPVIMQAVTDLETAGVPVFALISPLSATPERYIGQDNWKVGRTAAWAFAHMCKAPGKLGIFVGNHRYRCQEMNESGFRAYFRENAPEFTLLEPLSTFEQSTRLAGTDGAAAAGAPGPCRHLCLGRRHQRRDHGAAQCGKSLGRWWWSARVDGHHAVGAAGSYADHGHLQPAAALCDEAVALMIRASTDPVGAGAWTSIVPFEIYTSENI